MFRFFEEVLAHVGKDREIICISRRMLYNLDMRPFSHVKPVELIIVFFLVFVGWPIGENFCWASENWVEVELLPFVIDKKDKKKKVKFLDYRDRRQDLNFRFTMLYSSSQLGNNSLSSGDIENFKLDSKGQGFEVHTGVSFNRSIFSVGLDFGLASLSFEDNVELLQPKANLHFIVDGIWSNPYAVPFLKFGASKMDFKNLLPEVSEVKTNLSLFFSGGVMASMDWFQKTLSMDAYFSYGLDTSYLVLEYEFFPEIDAQTEGIPGINQNAFKVGFQLVF